MGDGLVPVCVLILFLILALASAFIYAFPMGMVLNYHIGLMISRNLRVWPTLGKLPCRFMRQQAEPFRYTPTQVKKVSQPWSEQSHRLGGLPRPLFPSVSLFSVLRFSAFLDFTFLLFFPFDSLFSGFSLLFPFSLVLHVLFLFFPG